MRREAEELSRFLLKPVLHVTGIVASPFLMLAFLFLLLEKPPLWVLLPLTVALLLAGAGALVWILLRARLLRLSRELERLAPPQDDEPRL